MERSGSTSTQRPNVDHFQWEPFNYWPPLMELDFMKTNVFSDCVCGSGATSLRPRFNPKPWQSLVSKGGRNCFASECSYIPQPFFHWSKLFFSQYDPNLVSFCVDFAYFSLHVWILSRYSSFLSQSKEMHIGLISFLKLSIAAHSQSIQEN